MRRSLTSWLAVLLLAAAAPAGAETSRERGPASGPLPVRDHFLLGAGFLGLEPAAADVLEPGRWQVEAVWSVSNTWAVSPQIDLALRARSQRTPVTREFLDQLARRSSDGGSIFVDGEVSRVSIALRRGVGKGVELQLLLPLVYIGGGRLDAPIENFHDALSLAQDGRNGAPRNAFLVSLITRRGDFLESDAPSLGLGDIVVGARLQLWGDRSSAFRGALDARAKLPTASDEPLVTSGEVDYGVQLLLTRRLGRWSIHGAGGVVLLGASKRLGIDSQELFSATAGVERAVGARTSLVLQVAAAQSPFEALATSRIGLTAIQATFGLKRAVGRDARLFVAFTDNFENFTNSSDLTLHLGISRTFN